MDWTKPYCGVTHLLGLPRGFQITLKNIRGEFVEAEVCLLNLKANYPFSRGCEFIGTLDECRIHGETWAKTL